MDTTSVFKHSRKVNMSKQRMRTQASDKLTADGHGPPESLLPKQDSGAADQSPALQHVHFQTEGPISVPDSCFVHRRETGCLLGD